MRDYFKLLVMMASAVICSICVGSAWALTAPSTQVYFNCVTNGTGCTTNLAQGNLYGMAAGTLITIGGYNTPFDNGGGVYELLGLVSSNCSTANFSSVTMSAKGYKLTFSGNPTPYPVGSLVTDTTTAANIPPGAEIVSRSYNSGTGVGGITLSVPATNNATDSISISGINGGTLLADGNSSMNQQCIRKVNYQGAPQEWGAFGNGTADDTTALQNWLAAPGPWIASIPATYVTNSPLTCFQGTHIQATANASREGMTIPLVTIVTGTSYPSGTPSAVMSANFQCHISGLAINAFDNGSGSCGTNNCQIDALSVQDNGVTIDRNTLLMQGYRNVECSISSAAGLQLKDSQFDQSFGNNIDLPNCGGGNVRVIGDIISNAGTVYIGGTPTTELASAEGIYFNGDDITISNGNVEQSQGIGIQLYESQNVSITGMFIEKNGENTANYGGAGLEIDGSKHVTVCSNHFKQNNYVTGHAHVRFAQVGGLSDLDVSLCGNVYKDGAPVSTVYPDYVYEVGSSTPVTGITLYENPAVQNTGITLSTALVPPQQVCPPGVSGSYAGCPAH